MCLISRESMCVFDINRESVGVWEIEREIERGDVRVEDHFWKLIKS